MPYGVLNTDELALCRQVYRHWCGTNGAVETVPRADLARELLRAHNAGATTYASLAAAITTRQGEAWHLHAIERSTPATPGNHAPGNAIHDA